MMSHSEQTHASAAEALGPSLTVLTVMLANLQPCVRAGRQRAALAARDKAGRFLPNAACIRTRRRDAHGRFAGGFVLAPAQPRALVSILDK